jgi:hypothetical protein
MSTEKEIQEVFEQEINEKSKLVERKFGKLAFYEGGKGMRRFKMTDTDPCWTKYQGEK